LASIEIVHDFSSEDAGFRAVVRISGSLILFPSERDHQWDFYSIGGSVRRRVARRRIADAQAVTAEQSKRRKSAILRQRR